MLTVIDHLLKSILNFEGDRNQSSRLHLLFPL